MATHPSALTPDEILAHTQYLRVLARRLAHDDSEAEDLVQETWIEALKSPLEGIARLRPWLVGVLRNVAREHQRGETRRRTREALAAEPESTSADGDGLLLERLESFRELAREVIELEEPYRGTIVACYFQGLSAQAVAERDGVPAATVRSRHLRALGQLRERLDRRYGSRSRWQALFLPFLEPRVPKPKLSWALPAALGAGLLLVAGGLWWSAAGREDPATLDESAQRAPSALGAAADAPALARAEPDAPLARVGAASAPQPVAPAGPPRARVALRLIDAATGEPVPWFELELLEDIRAIETLVSDAEGRVASAAEYDARRLHLHLLDHRQLSAWRERPRSVRNLPWRIPWDHAPADAAAGRTERELRVDVGPTYRVRTRGGPPPGADERWVALRASAGAAEPTFAPLRSEGGAGDWVRFSNETRAFGRPDDLRAAGRAGAWLLELSGPERCASGAVGHTEGASGPELELEWLPCGRLELAAVDEAGPLHARLGFERLDAPGAGILWMASELAALDRRLAVGRYRAWAVTPRHESSDTEFEIRRGATERIELVLRRRRGAGTVRGTIDARDIEGAVGVELLLTGRASGLELRTTSVVDEREPGLLHFRFDEVPEDVYELTAHARGVYAWDPPALEVRPPAGELVLRPRRAAQGVRLVLRAFDAASGDSVPRFHAALELAEPARRSPTRVLRESVTGSLHLGFVPTDEPLQWVVHAQGYRPARGDERSFTGSGELREVHVRLERGFGRELVLLDAQGLAVAGARVGAAGCTGGTSDAGGRVWLAGELAPELLEIAWPGAAAAERVALAPLLERAGDPVRLVVRRELR